MSRESFYNSHMTGTTLISVRFQCIVACSSRWARVSLRGRRPYVVGVTEIQCTQRLQLSSICTWSKRWWHLKAAIHGEWVVGSCFGVFAHWRNAVCVHQGSHTTQLCRVDLLQFAVTSTERNRWSVLRHGFTSLFLNRPWVLKRR